MKCRSLLLVCILIPFGCGAMDGKMPTAKRYSWRFEKMLSSLEDVRIFAGHMVRLRTCLDIFNPMFDPDSCTSVIGYVAATMAPDAWWDNGRDREGYRFYRVLKPGQLLHKGALADPLIRQDKHMAMQLLSEEECAQFEPAIKDGSLFIEYAESKEHAVKMLAGKEIYQEAHDALDIDLYSTEQVKDLVAMISE